MTDRPLRIFLVDDNELDVYLTEQALREHKIRHELTVVLDSSEANRRIQELGAEEKNPSPDIFLLDLNMPKADGYELFRSVKANRHCAKSAVIFVSSSDAPKDRKFATEQAHYFRKPSDLDEFIKLGELVRSVANRLETT